MDLGRIELPTRHCERRVMPLYYRPVLTAFTLAYFAEILKAPPYKIYRNYKGIVALRLNKLFIAKKILQFTYPLFPCIRGIRC